MRASTLPPDPLMVCHAGGMLSRGWSAMESAPKEHRMGIFLSVIESTDQQPGELAVRIPESGSAETKFGSQLVVRDFQRAIFRKDGKGTDMFEPGRHTLSTKNLPILTKI